jgi:hypothetical protein
VPFTWVTATQAPRSLAVQARTPAGAAREVPAASAAPDELAAKAAVVAISPAGGLRDGREMLHDVRPVVAWDPLFAASFCLLRL